MYNHTKIQTLPSNFTTVCFRFLFHIKQKVQIDSSRLVCLFLKPNPVILLPSDRKTENKLFLRRSVALLLQKATLLSCRSIHKLLYFRPNLKLCRNLSKCIEGFFDTSSHKIPGWQSEMC